MYLVFSKTYFLTFRATWMPTQVWGSYKLQGDTWDIFFGRFHCHTIKGTEGVEAAGPSGVRRPGSVWSVRLLIILQVGSSQHVSPSRVVITKERPFRFFLGRRSWQEKWVQLVSEVLQDFLFNSYCRSIFKLQLYLEGDNQSLGRQMSAPLNGASVITIFSSPQPSSK